MNIEMVSAGRDTSLSATVAAVSNTKWLLVFAIWFYGFTSYLDRVALSFAAPVIMRDLALSPATFGLVLSSFAIGYTIAQVPGGMVADRWGSRIVLVLVPLIWGILSGLTGMVTVVAGFVIARGGLGLTEGLAQGPAFKIQADNFLSRERPLLQGITLTPIALAPAVASPIVAYTVSSLNWRWVFFLLIVPSVLAAVINFALLPKSPTSAARVERPVEPHAKVSEAAHLLRQPTFWLLSLTWMTFNIAYWGFQGWMPSYLALERHVDIRTLGAVGGLPYLSGFFGLVAFGWLGATRLHGRHSLLLIVTLCCAGTSLFGAYTALTLTGSIAGLSASAFFLFGGLGVFYTLAGDYAPPGGRGVFWGAISTSGQLGGVLAPGLIGYLVSATGSFASGFVLMIVALACGVLSTLVLGRCRRTP